MKHNAKTINALQLQNGIFKVILFFLLVYGVLQVFKTPILSPCPDNGCISVQYSIPKTVDFLVDMYATKYGKTKWLQLRTKALVHFMLLREAAYGNTTTCGDSGLACGPLQFHEPTYISYRKQMISKGLAQDMGSRWDMENAIDTASYIINEGGENNWGPVARGEIKI